MMELKQGDCLQVMKELEKDSVDLLFADLPYAQTSCKWDILIDLDLFWKEVNRVCKPDAPMVFTCSVKFGNTLINSNPKKFRYDLIWVKSASCGFLNAKKMPMKKHEMIYVFYNKLPKVYTENIALHHKHKFLKEDKEKYIESSLYGNGGKDTQNKSVRQHKVLYKKSEYEPPLPNSIIKETNHENAYNTEKRKKPIVRSKPNQYEPPLPNSVVKEEKIVAKGNNIYSEFSFYNNGEKGYEPKLPNSILEVKSEKGKHATQKPVALMEWILKYYSREGGVVLDPTMGSGSMGVACLNKNRSFIGIEKDETIYKVAIERCGIES